jgi:hypothetical protein
MFPKGFDRTGWSPDDERLVHDEVQLVVGRRGGM